jgi:hypothetical protein
VSDELGEAAELVNLGFDDALEIYATVIGGTAAQRLRHWATTAHRPRSCRVLA